MTEEERLWMLIGRKLAGEASEEEVLELASLLEKNPESCYYMQVLSAWWNTVAAREDGQSLKGFNKVMLRIEAEKEQGIDDEQKPEMKNRSTHPVRRYGKRLWRWITKGWHFTFLYR
jgi:hypothetical protein